MQERGIGRLLRWIEPVKAYLVKLQLFIKSDNIVTIGSLLSAYRLYEEKIKTCLRKAQKSNWWEKRYMKGYFMKCKLI